MLNNKHAWVGQLYLGKGRFFQVTSAIMGYRKVSSDWQEVNHIHHLPMLQYNKGVKMASTKNAEQKLHLKPAFQIIARQ